MVLAANPDDALTAMTEHNTTYKDAGYPPVLRIDTDQARHLRTVRNMLNGTGSSR